MQGFRALFLLLLSLSGNVYASWGLNMTPGATNISRQIYDLHMLIFYICIGIGCIVFGVMFWSLVFHRKSRGYVPATFHENNTIEILWTIVPFFTLLAMAYPAAKVLINMDDMDGTEETIKITGYQWKWRYDYLDRDIGFFSNLSSTQDEIYNRSGKADDYLLGVDKPLVLPVDTKVKFVLTAADVIHSFWVPATGYKKDCIPGFINESWTKFDKEGTYYGRCAELCGAKHAYMPIVVEVKSKEDYLSWVEANNKK